MPERQHRAPVDEGRVLRDLLRALTELAREATACLKMIREEEEGKA